MLDARYQLERKGTIIFLFLAGVLNLANLLYVPWPLKIPNIIVAAILIITAFVEAGE